MSIPDGLRPTPFSARYPAGIEQWIDVYGFAVPLWLTSPEAEYAAFRAGVAALEYSMLYKWHIEGLDAIAAVDAVVSRNVAALEPGRLAYGVVVDGDGLMVDDVTIAVLDPQHVLVVGGNPATEEVLRKSAPAGTDLTERRDESAVLSLQGPRSRDVLAQLTDFEVSNEAFPYYTFRQDVHLAGIPATVNRVGFTAELGYELIVPVDRALDLWDALMDAGAAHDIRGAGAAALMMCRVEAGMVMGELEYDETVSPFECRMGWSVDFDKGAFQGREALLARKATDTGRVVTLRVDADPDGLDGATVFSDGAQVGHITMAVPSPHLGGTTIALARLHKDAAKVGTGLTVGASPSNSRAEVIPMPVYDPERTKVRS